MREVMGERAHLVHGNIQSNKRHLPCILCPSGTHLELSLRAMGGENTATKTLLAEDLWRLTNFHFLIATSINIHTQLDLPAAFQAFRLQISCRIAKQHIDQTRCENEMKTLPLCALELT